MDDLASKAAKGTAWMLAMRIIVNLLGISSMVVLARLLTPEDFGLVALAGSAYSFFRLFGQFGFEMPLIHLQNASRSHYDTAWTSNVLVGFCMAGAMLAVAKPAAAFFQDDRIEHIVYAFCILALAKGFENIGVVNFRKKLAFKGDFLYFVVPKLSSVFVGITAAVVLRNYWALVIGMLASQVTTLLYSHFSQPFRPRLTLEKFSELFKFTKWLVSGRIMYYLTSNSVEIIIGRFRGPEAVGLFGIASEVSHLPSTEIAAPINRALFPSFSTISKDLDRVRAAFVKVFAVIALLSLPAAFGIMAVAQSLVFVVFGEQWMPAASILAVLAIVGLLDGMHSLIEPVLMARGAVKTLTYIRMGHACVLIPTTITLVYFTGTLGGAYAMLISAFAALPMYLMAARAHIAIRVNEIAGCIWRPLVASVIMALAVRGLETLIGGPYDATVLTLLTLVALGIGSYCCALGLLWLVSGKPGFPEVMLFESVYGHVKARFVR